MMPYVIVLVIITLLIIIFCQDREWDVDQKKIAWLESALVLTSDKLNEAVAKLPPAEPIVYQDNSVVQLRRKKVTKKVAKRSKAK